LGTSTLEGIFTESLCESGQKDVSDNGESEGRERLHDGMGNEEREEIERREKRGRSNRSSISSSNSASSGSNSSSSSSSSSTSKNIIISSSSIVVTSPAAVVVLISPALVVVVVALNFFNLPNPSRRTIALGFTQSLTDMSIRRSFWGKARPASKTDNLTVTYEPTVQIMWDL
jgi:hypothetical protein